MARDWAAVAAAINTRLAELDMTQQELASRSGVSVATLRQLQRGMERRRSPRTLADVSEALRWPAGHLADVAGGAPDSGRAASPGRSPRASDPDEIAELRRAVAAMGDRLDAIEQRLAEG